MEQYFYKNVGLSFISAYGIYGGAANPGSCKYCGSNRFLIFSDTRNPSGEPFYEKTLNIEFCDVCGWWWLDWRNSEGNYEYGETNYAILKDFSNLKKQSFKESYLIQDLATEKIRLSRLQRKEILEAVELILKGHLNCEVELRKTTADGKLDLICFNSDKLGEFIVEVDQMPNHENLDLSIVTELQGVKLSRSSQKSVTPQAVIAKTMASFSESSDKGTENKIWPVEQRDIHDIAYWLDLLQENFNYEELDQLIEGLTDGVFNFPRNFRK